MECEFARLLQKCYNVFKSLTDQIDCPPKLRLCLQLMVRSSSSRPEVTREKVLLSENVQIKISGYGECLLRRHKNKSFPVEYLPKLYCHIQEIFLAVNCVCEACNLSFKGRSLSRSTKLPLFDKQIFTKF